MKSNHEDYRSGLAGLAVIFAVLPLVVLILGTTVPPSGSREPAVVDTLVGTTPYGSYRIIRTDTSFSGTVLDGHAVVSGIRFADTLELRQVRLGITTFKTKTRYPILSVRWETALLSISSQVHSLARGKQKLERAGWRLPSDVIDFAGELLPGEHNPLCETPETFPIPPIRFEVFYGSLTGTFTVRLGCIAIVAPGAITNLTDVKVYDGGALLSLAPGEELDAHLNVENSVDILGTVDIDGEIRAGSLRLDGSFFGASVAADAVNLTNRLEVIKGTLTLNRLLKARRSLPSSGDARSIALRQGSRVTVGELDAEHLSLGENSSLTVTGSARADILALQSSSMSVDLGLRSWNLRAEDSRIRCDHLVVSETPELSQSGIVELTAGSTLAVVADAETKRLTLNNSTITRSNVLTAATLHAIDNSSITARALRMNEATATLSRFDVSARIGSFLRPARMRLDTCSVFTVQIDVGMFDAKRTIVRTPLQSADAVLILNADTLLTDRVRILNPVDSIRISVSRRSQLADTYIHARRIHATLGNAFVDGGTHFNASEGGGAPRFGTVGYGWETGGLLPNYTGASHGGFGGTYGALNNRRFIPADEPFGSPVFSENELREGLGGYPTINTSWSIYGTQGGKGGGIVRIDATDMDLHGSVTADGGDGVVLGWRRDWTRQGKARGGGSGGTILFNVSGNLSGTGRITANGGRGYFGFDDWETGSGGSGGRIRIDYRSKMGWNGTVQALGGRGGWFDPDEMRMNVQAYPSMIPPWADSLVHGGPGTIYWKHTSGIGKILIDGSSGVRGGVAKIDGEFPMDTIEIRNATAVTNFLKARALVLREGALLKPDNPYVRLMWPIPRRYRVPAGYGLREDLNNELNSYPDPVWKDSLQEVLSLNFSSHVFIDSTSRLDATGFGFFGRAAASTGAGLNEYVGGSHGGYGGFGARNSIPPRNFGRPFPTYGNPLEPQSFGEGGVGEYGYRSDVTQWHYIHQFAGSGGGVVRLVCGGELRVDGAIRCDGAGGQKDNFSTKEGNGGGAGGSLWLSTASLTGSGIISASGGDGTYDVFHNNYGGGGAGGRIRIDYSNKTGWNGKVVAVGGRGAVEETHWRDPRNNGGPGTIYWNQLGGEKRIEIDDRDGNRGLGFIAGSYPSTSVEIRSAVVATAGLAAHSLSLRDSATLTGDDYRAGLKLFPANRFPTHSFPLWGERVDKRVLIRLTGNLHIDNGSAIDFSGLGLFGRSSNRMPGGSHGGRGGTGAYQTTLGNPSPAYGDSLLPMLSGQGGYGERTVFESGSPYLRLADAGASGGGAIRLVVDGTLELNGKILADGFSAIPQERGGAYGAGGGAGGSLLLRVGSLTGNGMISASGGAGVFIPTSPFRIWGGGGGGGRIAFYGNLGAFAGSLRADGGDGGSGSGIGPEVYRGQHGTIITGSAEPAPSGTFAILRTSPADRDTGVSRTATVRIVFNRSVDVVTFSFACSPDPGGWKVLWNITSDTLSLFHNGFAQAATYTFTIISANDLHGNTLPALPLQWRFSTGGTVTTVRTDESLPTDFALHQNYPNPFNPETRIRYALPVGAHVSLKLYNVLGQEAAVLVDAQQEAGWYEVRLSAATLPSGVYLYRLQAGAFTSTRKLLIIR
jgi:hypothetical protein